MVRNDVSTESCIPTEETVRRIVRSCPVYPFSLQLKRPGKTIPVLHQDWEGTPRASRLDTLLLVGVALRSLCITNEPYVNAAAVPAEQSEPVSLTFNKGQIRAKRFWAECHDDWDAYRARFVELMQEAQLTPMTVMVCFYLLYTEDTEGGRKRLAHLLLNGETGRLTELYNWDVLESFTPTRQDSFAPHIETLDVPLFPGAVGITKNDALLFRHRAQKRTPRRAEGSNESITKGLYREAVEKLEGGGYNAPTYNAQEEQVRALGSQLQDPRVAEILRLVLSIKNDPSGTGGQRTAQRGGR